MTPQTNSKKRIVFLFSDTGGGHRSSSEAIIEALAKEYPHHIETRMIDIFKEYAPMPLDQASAIYPQITRSPRVWEAGYRMSDGKRKVDLFIRVAWPYIRQAIRRLVDENPCDLFVSVHPFANRAFLNITQKRGIPFVTVVTDMVSVHALWFDQRANLVVVATEAARQRGIQLGLSPDQIVVAGQPVAERFCMPREDKMHLRSQLQWENDRPVILLVGGGEGMGPLKRIASAIDDANLRASLVIITGRNEKLRASLESRNWKMPVHIYGFVRDMPDFMATADILITKAGPGTISEAFIAGLPIILYSRLPGQEDGNVTYVVDHQAGVWAPETEKLVNTLKYWLENPEEMAKVSAISKNLGKPLATRQIAHLLARQISITTSAPLTLPSSNSSLDQLEHYADS